ncbi:MAG: response regulator [Acetatifactor sp.]
MYKVILIDDEPIIVQGLARSVPWEKYGCQVVDTAGDGLEGKRLIEKHAPDMVFLDICMPQMDGLAMVAALQSEYRNTQITILTGFRDFEYAKQALNLGVARYLLKPSNMEEIEEAIRFMASRAPDRGEEIREEPTEHGNVAGNFIVRSALAYIAENYKEKLLLSDVAEKTYVSQWHLSKLLNKETGQNFSEILNGIRIDKAKELMKDPSLRISDVAEQVGFLDLAHFSRVFKKLNGVSANEYRNQHRED